MCSPPHPRCVVPSYRLVGDGGEGIVVGKRDTLGSVGCTLGGGGSTLGSVGCTIVGTVCGIVAGGRMDVKSRGFRGGWCFRSRFVKSSGALIGVGCCCVVVRLGTVCFG